MKGPVLRIQCAHVAKGREAVAHVLLGVVKPRKRLGRRALQRLPRQIQAVDAKMDVSVDEPGANRRSLRSTTFASAGPADRVLHFGDGRVFDQDFHRAACRIAQAVEQLAAYDDRLRHSSLRSPGDQETIRV